MSGGNTNILIVEDDDALRDALIDTAVIAGLKASGAPHGRAALDALAHTHFDLVISDIQMDPMDGHALLREIRKRDRNLPVVLMTAYESIQSAVSALREGATDYLIKPFEAEVLLSRIDEWLPRLTAVNDTDIVAEDPVSKRVFELARRVAESDASVMITGESGVGKEVVFRAIHRHSNRAQATPVAINCAAIPENMLEAILFGYEKGAFTGAYKACLGKFEQAQDSTLLLDEVSEMPLGLQAKLLRVLQERQVERLGSQRLIDLDVRVVATCNSDLRAQVSDGRFREDLYYRLNVMPIDVPPLRARRADIIPLARALLNRAVAKSKKTPPELTPEARTRLFEYDWPGNVRELDNVMQRALIMRRATEIGECDLIFEGVAVTNSSEGAPFREAGCDEAESLGTDLKDHERRLILGALEEGRGSRKFASDKLGISPRTLRYKIARMREAGITIPGH
ncbi:MAG: sigma-54 dependent transcriptional regulator [Proteobacteria bacterium]|nr:sigma-54 dependent transcriptional regulator [Pseudomonadota bacterium]